MVTYLNVCDDGVAIFDATNHTQVRRRDLVEKVSRIECLYHDIMCLYYACRIHIAVLQCWLHAHIMLETLLIILYHIILYHIVLCHMSYFSPIISHQLFSSLLLSHALSHDLLFLLHRSLSQLRPTGAKILWVEVSNDNEVCSMLYYAVLYYAIFYYALLYSMLYNVAWCGVSI